MQKPFLYQVLYIHLYTNKLEATRDIQFNHKLQMEYVLEKKIESLNAFMGNPHMNTFFPALYFVIFYTSKGT